ncbi:hypothetical protein LRAMOSA00064 [Lichtheimia ramosa]|uniref:Alpha 1,4-glycosyltransferase domain-containing protein n=1 Tax=Lichtheimia ramosa TaxID=688394 RepID=A0A077W897_9FUNG|nr:hypothetical protein LRAMOSA00064 [Lichtheimia ramosa]
MPQSPFMPRQHVSRLPLHQQKTTLGNKTVLNKRWILRCTVICIFVFMVIRQWTSTSSMLSSYGRSRGDRDSTYLAELSVARNVKVSTPSAERIPKIVHFIHGLRGPEPTLDLIHYLAIKAAHDIVRPDTIYLHYHYMPVGEMFERVRPMVTLRQVPLVENIFGRPVSHFAHRADIVRLEALMEFGGIYFDLDLFALKPVDHLLDQEFVMGQEGVDGSSGLCNAMMMAKPNARFLQRYYATYSSFDSTQWNYHSVVLPAKLAPHFKDEITVLDYKAFFWPLWDSVGLRTLYLEKTYDFSDNLGIHIWESPSNKHLMQGVTEETMLNVDNSLYCILRPFILNGRPDPRPNACRILAHSNRHDMMLGHWSLDADAVTQHLNPMRADDDSGNDLAGLIRNSNYDADGIHTTGHDSYIFMTMPTETVMDSMSVSWWMKTETSKENGTAMVIQTDRVKLYVRTESIHEHQSSKSSRDAIGLSLATVKLENDWSWQDDSELLVHPNQYPVNQDDLYHHFMLIVDRNNTRHSMDPPLALYMDGHVIASHHAWQVPFTYNTTVRGVWFGSSEPERSNYQDPWDTRPSLDAWYRDIRIWERALSTEEVLYWASQKPKMSSPVPEPEEQQQQQQQPNLPNAKWVDEDGEVIVVQDTVDNQDDPLWNEEH